MCGQTVANQPNHPTLPAPPPPDLKSILMNVNAPDVRGSVFTVQYVADSLAKGVAPIAIGAAVAAAGGARTAVFSAALSGWLVSGAVICSVSLTVAADEEAAKSSRR